MATGVELLNIPIAFISREQIDTYATYLPSFMKICSPYSTQFPGLSAKEMCISPLVGTRRGRICKQQHHTRRRDTAQEFEEIGGRKRRLVKSARCSHNGLWGMAILNKTALLPKSNGCWPLRHRPHPLPCPTWTAPRTRDMVENALKCANPFSAPGIDRIPTGVLVAMGPCLVTALQQLAQACIDWQHHHTLSHSAHVFLKSRRN